MKIYYRIKPSTVRLENKQLDTKMSQMHLHLIITAELIPFLFLCIVLLRGALISP